MRVGAYEILGLLGKGGMGAVYRARAPSGEAVALKVLARASPEKVARFERERRLLEDLAREGGFVPLLDAGSAPEGPFIVMPLLSGGTLRARLDQGPLGLEKTLELGRTLARALGRAHEKGIVHRDLKPENIIFDGGGRPLIVDLGLAKHFDRESDEGARSISISLEGAFRGTVGYASPEQVSDSKSAGPESDVFALGAVLHECLAGRPAFSAENVVGLMTKLALGQHERLRSADAPPWLAAVIERALATRPEDRIACGAALLAALEGNREARRSRSLAAPAVLVAIIGLVGGVLALRGRAPAASEGGPPDPAVSKPVTAADRTRAQKALAGVDVVSSAAAPWAAVRGSDELEKLAADHAVVYAADEVARELATRHGRSLEILHALALLGQGGRDEGKAILLRENPGGRTATVLEALVAGDEVATFGAGDEPTKAGRRLANTLPVLAQEPRRFVETVLAPVASVARVRATTLEVGSSLGPLLRSIFREQEDHVLESLPPRFLASLMASEDLAPGGHLGANGAVERLERRVRLVRAVAGEDPVLAAAALMGGVRSASDPLAGDDLARLHGRFEAVLVEARAVLASGPHAPADDEWAALTLFWIDEISGDTNLGLGLRGDAEAAVLALRRALVVTRQDRPSLVKRRARAAQHYAQAVLAARPDVATAVAEIGEETLALLGRSPLLAEVRRRQGRAKDALELLSEEARRDLDNDKRWIPAFHAVRVLALLDLGRPSEATAELPLLGNLADDDSLGIPGLRAGEVRARVAAGR